jgi:hypothetical protein
MLLGATQRGTGGRIIWPSSASMEPGTKNSTSKIRFLRLHVKLDFASVSPPGNVSRVK